MAVTSTVGGVTSGYCATGSVNTATPPASTKTMDRTEAKMGRSMKKWEIMDVALRPLPPPHPQPLSPEGRGENIAPLAPLGRGVGGEGGPAAAPAGLPAAPVPR